MKVIDGVGLDDLGLNVLGFALFWGFGMIFMFFDLRRMYRLVDEGEISHLVELPDRKTWFRLGLLLGSLVILPYMARTRGAGGFLLAIPLVLMLFAVLDVISVGIVNLIMN